MIPVRFIFSTFFQPAAPNFSSTAFLPLRLSDSRQLNTAHVRPSKYLNRGSRSNPSMEATAPSLCIWVSVVIWVFPSYSRRRCRRCASLLRYDAPRSTSLARMTPRHVGVMIVGSPSFISIAETQLHTHSISAWKHRCRQ